MSKSKTKTTTNQTQTAAPPSFTAPGLTDAANMVTAGLSQIPTTHYTGDMVASMDPAKLAQIMAAYTGTAQTAGQMTDFLQGMLPSLNQGMSFTTQLPDTSYSLAPKQDLNNVINASIDPVFRQLTGQILPGITNSALDAGAYSGDRAMSVLPTEAIRNATETAQNIASQLGYEDYQNYENRRLAAYQATTQASQQNYALENQRQQQEAALRMQQLGLAPEFINSILHTQASGADLLKMAADLETQQQQAGYNNAIAKDQYASQAPFMGLDTASELLARLSGGYGTQTMQGTTTQTTKQPLASQLIQGAIGLGSMAAGFPGIGSALGLGGAVSPATTGASSLFHFDPNKPFG